MSARSTIVLPPALCEPALSSCGALHDAAVARERVGLGHGQLDEQRGQLVAERVLAGPRLGCSPAPAPAGAVGQRRRRATSSRWRRPPAQIASTTSLTVPPRRVFTALTSARSRRTVAKWRVPLIGPFRLVCGAPITSSRTTSSTAARTRSSDSRGCARRAEAGPRAAQRPGRARARSGRCACSPSSPSLPASGCAGSGGASRGGVEQQVADVERADAIDEAVVRLARQRPAPVPRSPSSSVISHSGRWRSRRCDQKSPSHSCSSASPPGAGSVA